MVSTEDRWKYVAPVNTEGLSIYQNVLIDVIARRVVDAVGAKHCLRIDFRVANGIPYVIDINMIPGLAPDGYMSMCMKEHGVEYLDFIRKMVGTAS